jgi:CRP-like cAMP-binding protein
MKTKTNLIVSQIKQHLSLDKSEIYLINSMLIPRPFKQGEIIVEAASPAQYMIFVNDGYLMTYYTDKKDTDHVVQFATTGWWTGDMFSLLNNVPTLYTTRALSDGEILIFPKASHEQLLNSNPKFEKYFRIIFQRSMMWLQLRLVENFSADAKTRYLSFSEKFPKIEQFVPQKYIASYLGITPEFLSKLKKTKLKRA